MGRHAAPRAHGSSSAARRLALALLVTPSMAAVVTVALGITASTSANALAPLHTATTAPAATGWYWKDAVEQVGLPLDPAAGEQPSQVPSGDLPVGEDARGLPTDESYLAIDGGVVPAGFNVSSLTVTAKVDTANSSGTVPSTLIACLAKAPFSAGPGHDWAEKPADDCSSQITGNYDATTNLVTFNLDALASDLLADSSNGLGILPPAATAPAQQPYTVDLVASSVSVQVAYFGSDYFPPVVLPSQAPASQPPAPAPVTVPAGSVTVTLPSALPVPVATPSPVVAPSTSQASTQPQSVSAGDIVAVASTHSTPSSPFLLGLLAGAAALAGIAVLLHDSETATPAAVLRRRAAVRRSSFRS